MKTILANWKTSLLGGGVLSAALIYLIQNPNDWQHAVALAIPGILGLLAADGTSNSQPTKSN